MVVTQFQFVPRISARLEIARRDARALGVEWPGKFVAEIKLYYKDHNGSKVFLDNCLRGTTTIRGEVQPGFEKAPIEVDFNFDHLQIVDLHIKQGGNRKYKFSIHVYPVIHDEPSAECVAKKNTRGFHLCSKFPGGRYT